MKPTDTKINAFMSTANTSFVIPVYQRNYDWNEQQCKRLMDDILEISSSTSDNHFLGIIVYFLEKPYSASGLNELTIIDGQQRLTTITLIYAAIYHIVKRMGNDNTANQIYEQYLINKFSVESEKMKLKPTENNKTALHNIINGMEDDIKYENSRMVCNFKYLSGLINENNYEQVLHGLSKLIFVDISLEREKDNPQRIFETLNSTGLELSQADLIRNHILMGLSTAEQEKIYKNYWEKIEQHAKDYNINETRVSDFIRDYLILKNHDIPSKKEVFSIFKTQFEANSINDLEKILLPLKSLAVYYEKLLNPSCEKDDDIRRHIEYIKLLEINVSYPFLMKVYEDYGSGIIDKPLFINVLELVQSFIFRRFIVGLPTNRLGQIFMMLCNKIDINNYLFSIQEQLMQGSGQHRFPDNYEVKTCLKIKDMYSIPANKRMYFFERIENHNHEVIVIDKKLTIEHIFPQNPDPKWKIEMGDAAEFKYIKDILLNTIGNLTLSAFNGALGNKPFQDKCNMNTNGKQQGYKYSKLWLNSDLKEKSTWNRAEIEKRTNLITDTAIDTWKYPDISINKGNGEVNIFEIRNFAGKNIKYYIFLGHKVDIKSKTINELYKEFFGQIFTLHSDWFFSNSKIAKTLLIPLALFDSGKPHIKLSNSMSITADFTDNEKINIIKSVLRDLRYEDELVVKIA
jgi:uncharacterized protein with ParB-like and HNH nuclease domain